jgi:flagellar export protein FliJ
MFRFRLARLLDYRRRCEEYIERDLRQKQHTLQEEQTHLAALQEDRHNLEEQFSNTQGSDLFGAEVQRWRVYYQALEQRMTVQETVVIDATNAMEATRQELLTARQEKKVLEKLEDNAYQRYSQERRHHEQRLLDEIAIIRSRYGD